MAKKYDYEKIWVHRVPEEILCNKKLLKELISVKGKEIALTYATPELKNDKELLNIVLEKAPFILGLIDSENAQNMSIEYLLNKQQQN